jgi:hypothetical protein
MDTLTTPLRLLARDIDSQDGVAMSPASTGSVEPVAYQAVDEYGRPFGYAQIILPFGKWPKSERVALYLQPQPTLTDAERTAIQRLIEDYEGDGEPASAGVVATLRGLLERTK